ncbi:hypothetical protein ACIQVR_27185 [Streptomyces xanthochromogenes]|uniref:hypothetical protein n=1 Tax=Streptomyces xanthochromogenes TaxID=67384 RepID=UPI00382658CB
MIEPAQLPGSPLDLSLCFSYDDDLAGSPYTEALERWTVEVFHRPPRGAADEQGLSTETVGSMVFWRVNLERGDAFGALEEESEDLAEIAHILLDMKSGTFHSEVSGHLPYAGSALLIMDRVSLTAPWRGWGLGYWLAAEAMRRLMPGCRAIACVPGISDLSAAQLRDRAEWERVRARITDGWRRLGFWHFCNDVHLLSPTSLELETQLDVLRGRAVMLATEHHMDPNR